MEEPVDAVGPTPPVVSNVSAPSVLSDVEGAIEFRTLIVLLTLATAINHNGHAILKQIYDEDYRAPLELTRRSSKLEKRLLLGAFAAIFIRDHEVIAAAASEQTVDASVSPVGHLSSGVYQVLAMQDESVHAIQDEPNYRDLDVEEHVPISDLTAIANPRGKITRPWERKRKGGKRKGGRKGEETNSAHSEGLPYTFAPKGRSHFDVIFNMSNWSWLDVVE
jgi:hypothetical protein